MVVRGTALCRNNCIKSHPRDLNPKPSAYEALALPIELGWRSLWRVDRQRRGLWRIHELGTTLGRNRSLEQLLAFQDYRQELPSLQTQESITAPGNVTREHTFRSGICVISSPGQASLLPRQVIRQYP